MGLRVQGKKKVVNMGMAGTRIEGKDTVKITDGSRMFCTPLPPGQRLGRIINRLGLGSKKTEPDGVTYQGTAAQPKTEMYHNRAKGTCQWRRKQGRP